MAKKAEIGMRVKIARGTSNGEDGALQHAIWIAGEVPAGSTGTVVAGSLDGTLQIVWDHGPEPKAGYEFGVGRLAFEVEEIGQ